MLRLISPAPCCALAAQSDSLLRCTASELFQSRPSLCPAARARSAQSRAIARLISPVLCRRAVPLSETHLCLCNVVPNYSLPSPLASSRSRVIHCRHAAMRCAPTPQQSGSNHSLALPLPCVAIRCFTAPSPPQIFFVPINAPASPRLSMPSSRLTSQISALLPPIYSVLGFAFSTQFLTLQCLRLTLPNIPSLCPHWSFRCYSVLCPRGSRLCHPSLMHL